MVAVFSLKLDSNCNGESREYLLGKASDETKKKVNGFYHKEDAYRSLFAEFLARYLFMQRTSLPNEELIIRRSAYGKPSFVGLEHIHFNLSHSGDWIVCAMGEHPVGIDIEQMLNIDLNDVTAFLSETERIHLFSQKQEVQQSYFYDLWTLKESYVKQRGLGLSIPPDTFTIDILDKHISLKRDVSFTEPVYFKQYDIDVNYKTAVCAGMNDFAAVVPLSLPQIVAAFA